jgi:hypothetical protein
MSQTSISKAVVDIRQDKNGQNESICYDMMMSYYCNKSVSSLIFSIATQPT